MDIERIIRKNLESKRSSNEQLNEGIVKDVYDDTKDFYKKKILGAMGGVKKEDADQAVQHARINQMEGMKAHGWQKVGDHASSAAKHVSGAANSGAEHLGKAVEAGATGAGKLIGAGATKAAELMGKATEHPGAAVGGAMAAGLGALALRKLLKRRQDNSNYGGQ